ncbi:LLM class flavin-dependent oxidoreductase [Microbulbifer pacificus]|uniref:LLM class flavin-dependent oxidoreductase n=1 Tax=Microbulbifer pacificus TaxID=407164 RepID=A0AAU0N3R5_9GAMM|nr:LLM class flavin-dependent oxidoreductase [Microbulbifer pacificus]WOX07010.1 LLM class flavin-dependent oxidoreductase [Microbulbifer pacificus]
MGKLTENSPWKRSNGDRKNHLIYHRSKFHEGDSMIKVWSFEFNQVPGKALPDYYNQNLVQKTFDNNLNLLASLESVGFEGVFFSEHHFINSMSPCPNLLVAALAARTKHMKIGVMGNVLPFHQPWRLAEEISMLDYITSGRLEIGVSSGVPPEFFFIDMPIDQIRPRYKEILDFLQMASTETKISMNGKYYNFDEVTIMPPPRKESRRRHWVTIYSDTSCRDAAHRNFKVCTGFQSVRAAGEAFDAYRDEAANLGRDVGVDDIGIRRQIMLWPSQSEAEALHAEFQVANQERMAQTFQTVYDRLSRGQEIEAEPADSVKQSGVMDAAAVPHEVESQSNSVSVDKPTLNAKGGLDVSEDEFIFGTPANVAEQIIDQCERLGAGNIMAYHPPTMDEAQLAKNYELWSQVIPILQKAKLGVPEPA